MPDTLTPNYHWTKPDPGSSPTTWGAKVNTNYDSIDGQVKTTTDAAATAQTAAATAQTAANTAQTAANAAQTTANAAQASATAGAMPIGGIIAWPSVTPPTNWLLCNGGSYSTATYPALAVVLGTTYGAAGILPNFKSTGLLGADPAAGFPLAEGFPVASPAGSDYSLIAVNFIIRAK